MIGREDVIVMLEKEFSLFADIALIFPQICNPEVSISVVSGLKEVWREEMDVGDGKKIDPDSHLTAVGRWLLEK